MKLQKLRWSKVYESSEEELVEFLKARGLKAERKTAEAFHETAQTYSAQLTTLWCAEGSFNLKLETSNISMQPGDAVRIPAGTDCTLNAGMSGCVYYETLALQA